MNVKVKNLRIHDGKEAIMDIESYFIHRLSPMSNGMVEEAVENSLNSIKCLARLVSILIENKSINVDDIHIILDNVKGREVEVTNEQKNYFI
jgi:hypothetical protein